MAITQREWDIMQLESKLRVNDLVAEWRTGFYGERLQPQGLTQGQQAPPLDGPNVAPSPATLPPAPPPQPPEGELRRSEVFGEQEIPELDEVEL